MITPVHERRDAFINTAGFHREMPVFRNIPKKEHRNIFFNFLLFFFSFLFFSFLVRANQVRHRSFKIFLNAFIYQDVVFFEHNTEIEGEKLQKINFINFNAQIRDYIINFWPLKNVVQ